MIYIDKMMIFPYKWQGSRLGLFMRQSLNLLSITDFHKRKKKWMDNLVKIIVTR